MSHATAALDGILGSGDFQKVAGVPLFDAHSEYDGEGNLVRKFDETRLRKSCQINNQRAELTGNLATVGPGHTIIDGPEDHQPPVWAYAHNWRVEPFGKAKTPTIHADLYVRPNVETSEGRPLKGI